jgi:hypothetical protein
MELRIDVNNEPRSCRNPDAWVMKVELQSTPRVAVRAWYHSNNGWVFGLMKQDCSCPGGFSAADRSEWIASELHANQYGAVSYEQFLEAVRLLKTMIEVMPIPEGATGAR